MVDLKTNPPPATAPPRVGDLMLEQGTITDEQLKKALVYQKSSGHRKLLGEVLVELEFVTQDQVMATLAGAYGLPFTRLTPQHADPKVIELLDREFITKQHALPLFLIENKLTVALAEPTNVFLVEEIERLTGHSIQVVATTAADIDETAASLLPDDNVFIIDQMMGEVERDRPLCGRKAGHRSVGPRRFGFRIAGHQAGELHRLCRGAGRRKRHPH